MGLYYSIVFHYAHYTSYLTWYSTYYALVAITRHYTTSTSYDVILCAFVFMLNESCTKRAHVSLPHVCA